MAKRNCRSTRLTAVLIFCFATSCFQNQESKATSTSDESYTDLSSELRDSLVYPDLTYSWPHAGGNTDAMCYRIACPDGYSRLTLAESSFGNWLRFLPMKPQGSLVLLHSGEEKWNQQAHHSVIDMDVGKRNLQQCADAVMRLRAEYLYQAREFDSIHFNYTSGDRIDFSKWITSQKPKVKGNAVSWVSCSSCDQSYPSFRAYMNSIFTYAGTSSLARELPSTDLEELMAGDVFIQPGFPGHAVLVVDRAENESGDVIFLLAQSYMPAQEMHILKNPTNIDFSPWYRLSEVDAVLYTPEWDFSPPILKRFAD